MQLGPLAARVAFAAVVFGLTLEVAARVAFRNPGFVAAIQGSTAAGRRAVWRSQVEGPQSRSFAHLDFVTHDPELGWTTTPRDSTEDLGYTILPDGTRDAGPATAASPRIALIGDSFTFGFDVDDAQTWVSQLQRAVQADLINAGVPGFGLDMTALRYRRDVAPMKPDIVVLGLNDLMVLRMARSWDAWAKPWMRYEDGALVTYGQPVPTSAQVRDEALPLRMLDVAAIWWEMSGAASANHGPPTEPYALAAQVLYDLHQRTQRAGSRLVLVNLAVASEPHHPPRVQTDQMAWLWEGACRLPDVHCTDTWPRWQSVSDADWPAYTLGTHWSAKGNALTADIVADDWVKAGIVQAMRAY